MQIMVLKKRGGFSKRLQSEFSVILSRVWFSSHFQVQVTMLCHCEKPATTATLMNSEWLWLAQKIMVIACSIFDPSILLLCLFAEYSLKLWPCRAFSSIRAYLLLPALGDAWQLGLCILLDDFTLQPSESSAEDFPERNGRSVFARESRQIICLAGGEEQQELISR